jgi:hypothetical protein
VLQDTSTSMPISDRKIPDVRKCDDLFPEFLDLLKTLYEHSNMNTREGSSTDSLLKTLYEYSCCRVVGLEV